MANLLATQPPYRANETKSLGTISEGRSSLNIVTHFFLNSPINKDNNKQTNNYK